MCEVHQLWNKFNSGVSSSTKTTASLFKLVSVQCWFSSVTVLMLQKNEALQKIVVSLFSFCFVLIQPCTALLRKRLLAVWCISADVWCCCCFPGLPRVSHHLSDIKAGQHASVLRGSRAEIIVRHCVSTLTHSFSLSLVAQWKCELSHVPTSWNSHVWIMNLHF